MSACVLGYGFQARVTEKKTKAHNLLFVKKREIENFIKTLIKINRGHY